MALLSKGRILHLAVVFMDGVFIIVFIVVWLARG
jgi:hypothetical protein